MNSISIINRKGIHREGKEITRPVYDDILPVTVDGEDSDCIFKTITRGELGLIKVNDDDTFEELNGNFYTIGDFEDGVAIVTIDDGRFGIVYGLVNTDLIMVAECIYRNITRLKNGFFDVEERRSLSHGVINSKGESIIPCGYKSVAFKGDTGKFEVEIWD